MENIIVVLAESNDQADAVELRAAAIVERYADGRWHMPQEAVSPSSRGAVTGGAVGGVIGQTPED